MKLLKEVNDYVVSLTNLFEQNPHGPDIITPILPTRLQKQPKSTEYLLPPVIIWDPLLQFPHIFAHQFYCDKDSHSTRCVPLTPKRWKNGLSEKDSPRKIYGKDSTVLLVSRVYVCCEGHEIIAHDPSIVDKLPPENVPFYLSHKSGVTRDLANTINSLANTGLTFTEIERHVAQEYYNCHWLKEGTFRKNARYFHDENGNASDKGSSEPFPDCKEWVELPSDDIIIGCFILHFEENNVFYTERMSDLSALYLSADHTFKVAANIGVRLPGNKWVTQYDSLFCVLNEKGQVVAWQLTKGTSFNHVEDLLKDLKKRLDNQNVTLNAIYVDNCCHVRKKITEIFGTNIPVKLDLFHAISRVTKKIPKCTRHYMTGSCILDFANVFRSHTDKEKERKQPTPSPEQMERNLTSFLKKWNNVQHGEEESVLTSGTIQEIQCLRKHIEKGCLSGIPAGAGSERNENMHRNLRHIIARSRLGVKSAIALLTSFFYQWNERKEKRFVKGIVPPISYYAQHTNVHHLSSETFGVRSAGSIDTCDDIKEGVSNFLGVRADVFQMHGILQSDVKAADTLKQVLSKGLNYLLVDKEITAMSDSRCLNTRLIHLMPCSLTLFSHNQHCMVRDPLESLNSLKQLLSEYGLQLHQQPEELKREDSFFFSLVTSITCMLHQLKLSKIEHDAVLAKVFHLGILANPNSVLDDMKKLRQEISKEWEQNASAYQKLLPTSDLNFTEEILNFRSDGYFVGKYLFKLLLALYLNVVPRFLHFVLQITEC